MSPLVVPTRVAWAVELLEPDPTSQVLEIGPGRGVCAALVCAGLDGGGYVGVDRSATAVRAAEQRVADAVAAGVARFACSTFESLDPGELGTFDRVLAINVNLFWTRSAQEELAAVRRLLRPGGRFLLVYDGPGGSSDKILGPASRNLDAAGLAHEVLHSPDGHVAFLHRAAE